MQKSILIFCAALATFGLTAFGYINWNNELLDHEEVREADSDFFYKIDNRWGTMTKQDLNKVKSIRDIIHNDGTCTREAFRNVRVSILHNDKDVRDVPMTEVGQSELFNTAQLALLRSCDYSTNLRITALNKRTDTKTGIVAEYDSLVRYMTIIPEKEVEFKGGFDALIEYLKENSKEETANLEQGKIQPGKIFFTVTKNGTIENLKPVATSGYPAVDKTMLELIEKMPKNWEPATNSKGEKVDQELVFSYGIIGC